MGRQLNKEAWEILTKDEKTALTLALGHGKSSWQAGEIMQKAHYKYLEIEARAEKFLRMFTEFYDEYGDLIPRGVDIPNTFKEYLSLVILSRLTVKDAIARIDDPEYKVSSFRDRIMEQGLIAMSKSRNQAEKDLFDLVLEFDRWNNFRVLPKGWQQPSAFKRRNKSKELKYLKNISQLPPISIEKVQELYSYTGNNDHLWVPIVSKTFKDLYKIMKVKDRPLVVDNLSKMGFVIFKDKLDAEEFAIQVHQYVFKKQVRDNSHVILGLKFWGRFRGLLIKAHNFNKLENIIPNRKFMEDARIEEGIQHKKKLRRKKA